jgi:hypothetical protein
VQTADHERRRQFLEQIASKMVPDVAGGQIQGILSIQCPQIKPN